MKAYFGKKAIVSQLLKIADLYIDSCEDEYHKDTHYMGIFLVTLAKRYLK